MTWFGAVLPFLAGTAFGLLVGWINRKLIRAMTDRMEDYPPDVAKRRFIFHFFLRFGINFLALLLTYRWVPALLGAALGLIIMQKTLIVQYIFLRKGVKK